MSDTAFLMRTTLQVAVPQWIETMRTWSEERRLACAHDAAQVVAEKGDILQFRSKKKGETAEAFNALARGIAAASYTPGGITFLGDHWETKAGDDGK